MRRSRLLTRFAAATVTAITTVAAAGPPAPQGAWLLGDLHVHDDHSSDGSLLRQCCDDQGPGTVSIADQVGFATLLGLDFLPLTDHRTYDQHYDPLWRSDALLLIPGEEANGSPHATVHGGVDTIVQGPARPGSDFAHVQQSIWDAHAQGAAWITAHPDDGETNEDGTPNARASVVGVDLVEAWNRGSDVDAEIAYVEDRWNHGFRFGIAGASDNHFRELWLLAGPGMPTTGAFAPARTERALLGALHAGRTRISADPGAPAVTLDADFDGDGVFEALGGDEVLVPNGTHGRLRIRVDNAAGTTVYLYQAPGRSAPPLAVFTPTLVETQATYTHDVVTAAGFTWFRAEVRGFGLPAGFAIGEGPIEVIPDPQELPDQLRALASPLFVSQRPAVARGELRIPRDRYAGLDDGAVHALGVTGEFSGFPDLAVAAGVRHVVAEAHAGGTSRVLYRRLDDAGAGAEVVLSGAATSARFPRIAARGDVVQAVWQDDAVQMPHRPRIVTARSTDGGRSWSAPADVRAVDGRCEHPDIVLDLAGEPVIAWQENGPGLAFDVMLLLPGAATPRNASGDGKTIAAASPLDSRSSRYPASVWPALAVSRAGVLALAWQDNRTDVDPLWTGALGSGEGTDPDDWQVTVATFARNGAPLRRGSLGAVDRADRHPSLAFDRGGRLYAAWDSKELRSSGASLAVLAATSTDDGASWTAPAVLGADAGAMSQYPRLGGDAQGRVRAVWYDSRSRDWRWRVMTALADASGSFDRVRLITSPGNNTWPATDGGWVAFAGTRNAVRPQRDRTQQVFLLER